MPVSNPCQLEILIAAVKLMEANLPQNKELLVHSERFVDSWFEETIIWLTASFFTVSITENLNFRCFSIGSSSRQLRLIRKCLEH